MSQQWTSPLFSALDMVCSAPLFPSTSLSFLSLSLSRVVVLVHDKWKCRLRPKMCRGLHWKSVGLVRAGWRREGHAWSHELRSCLRCWWVAGHVPLTPTKMPNPTDVTAANRGYIYDRCVLVLLCGSTATDLQYTTRRNLNSFQRYMYSSVLK